MNRVILILFLYILAFYTTSCKKKFDCFTSNGKTVLDERTLGNFSSIDIQSHLNVTLIQDSLNFVEIIGGENIIPEIDCYIDNGILTLKNNAKCNWVRKYSDIMVFLHFAGINEIDINGEVILSNNDTLYGDSIIVNVYSDISEVSLTLRNKQTKLNIHAGTGNYTFAGKTINSYIYCHGTAFIHAGNLETGFTSVNHQSTGDFYVNVNDILHVILKSTGNLYYKGNPALHIEEISSTGQIIKN